MKKKSYIKVFLPASSQCFIHSVLTIHSVLIYAWPFRLLTKQHTARLFLFIPTRTNLFLVLGRVWNIIKFSSIKQNNFKEGKKIRKIKESRVRDLDELELALTLTWQRPKIPDRLRLQSRGAP